LSEAAARCAKIKSEHGQDYSGVIVPAMDAFTAQMLDPRRSLIDRAGVFSPSLASDISEAFLSLQDDISDWFQKFTTSRFEDAQSSLPDIIRTRHNQILGCL